MTQKVILAVFALMLSGAFYVSCQREDLTSEVKPEEKTEDEKAFAPVRELKKDLEWEDMETEDAIVKMEHWLNYEFGDGMKHFTHIVYDTLDLSLPMNGAKYQNTLLPGLQQHTNYSANT